MWPWRPSSTSGRKQMRLEAPMSKRLLLFLLLIGPDVALGPPRI